LNDTGRRSRSDRSSLERIQGPQNSLALAQISVADVLEAQKQNLDEALRLYRDAITVLDDARPRSRYDTNIIDGHLRIGDILLFKNDQEDALTEYKSAAAIARDSVAANPSSAPRQGRLAASYSKIGDLLAQASLSEAREQYQQALEILTALAAKNPTSKEWPPLTESLKAKMQKLNL
jgi:tetratricopeptide (TPR) repeat protein